MAVNRSNQSMRGNNREIAGDFVPVELIPSEFICIYKRVEWGIVIALFHYSWDISIFKKKANAFVTFDFFLYLA